MIKMTSTYLLPLLVILLASAHKISAQDFTLTGRVVDEEQNPIELATVSCLEQGKVTATNLKGEFKLSLKIYHPQNGDINISGGEIKGHSGIHVEGKG